MAPDEEPGAAQVQADAAEEQKAAKAAATEAAKKEEKKMAAVAKKASKTYKGGKKAMTWVGFQQIKDGSRVFIKTSAAVDYRITEAGPETLVVELMDTIIPTHNNRRPLDTSFFPAAVAMITPTSSKGSVKIEIKLKERVPFITKQEDNSLFVDFEKPGKMGPAKPAAKPKFKAPKKAR
jgi:hypothetical protein